MATEKFSLFSVAAIVIANMIGTGVFATLGYQLVDIQSGFVILCLWVLGGLVAVCGALCYAELGARLPRSGGEYNFLGRIYHPLAGFISGWISATVGFAAPTALAAITFGTYLSSVFPVLPPLLLATALVVILALVHATSHRYSAGLQNIFTLAKICVIVVFSVTALVVVDAFQPIRFVPDSTDIGAFASGTFAVALIYVGYAYSGWNAATYLIDEIDNPARILPPVLAVGTGIVMLLYVLLNSVFLLVAPVDALTGQLEVGTIAAGYAFGDLGATIIGVTVALLLVSTVSAMIVAAPRVLQVIGEDYSIFRYLSRVNNHDIPARAILIQGMIALVFMWSASFESILIFAGATMALNTLFAVIGLIVLRRRQSHHETGHVAAARPVFKVPWYPLPPIIFIGVTGWTLVYLVIERPVEILFSVGIIATGAAGYFMAKRF
ncbi:MAG: amino acid permease [Gammaproteobacteria bacterium]|jgi:APA family basic amino acid/polyamine antiporter|nr:amino acid permease [Chromatiales bacterium]MDP6674194.1 amino acid permease [Gammaproteobacteria bacterium]